MIGGNASLAKFFLSGGNPVETGAVAVAVGLIPLRSPSDPHDDGDCDGNSVTLKRL
jgi:hypothetical protein